MRKYIFQLLILAIIGNFCMLYSNEQAKDLIHVGVEYSQLMKDNNLPYIWRASDYFLATWDINQRTTAKLANIQFDTIVHIVDFNESFYIVNLRDDQILPEELIPFKLHMHNHDVIVKVKSEEMEKFVMKGFEVVLIPLKEEKFLRDSQLVSFTCTYNGIIDELLSRISQNQWLDWIEKMSGVEPIDINGSLYTVATRYSTSLFDGSTNAKAYDFALQQVQWWNYGVNIEEDPYNYSGKTWKNLILTIPGQTAPDDIVIISAHFDSISSQPTTAAPGADDNMSGSATLFEAARILRQFRFQRTIKIIFFTGEEQGLIGSNAYVNDHPYNNILGVVNMDMFGYDGDNDRCFEIHAGTMTSSQDVGNCFADSIAAYNLNLSYDFITNGATTASDHASFWSKGVGAIEILENGYNNSLPNGCIGTDFNPYYHSINDTIPNMSVSYSYDIARAGLASIAAMAIPIQSCFSEVPVLAATAGLLQVNLSWTSVTGAATYRIYRSLQGCNGQWFEIAEINGTNYSDTNINPDTTYYYYVEAVDSDGFCVSSMSNCESVTPPSCESCAKYQHDSAYITEISGGDSDIYPDNCEVATAQVTIQNIGSGTAINTMVNVTSNDPFINIITPMPINAGNIPVGSSVPIEFTFNVGMDLSKANCMQDGQFNISVQAEGQSTSADDTFSFIFEVDEYQGNISWEFEPATDLEGWTVVSGTWALSTDRYNPGTSTASLHSSQYLDQQCDVIMSPVFKPSATSVLNIPNWYSIEPQSNYWYDRANIHIINTETNERVLISPYDGKLYQTGQFYNWGTSCNIFNEQGWSGASGNYWGNSYFDLSSFNDLPIKIEIRYMTDPSANGEGIYVDDISVTNVTYFGCDNQSDNCIQGPYLMPYNLNKPIVNDSGSTKANVIIDEDESVILVSTMENIGTGVATEVSGIISSTDNIIIDQPNAIFPDIPINEYRNCTSCYALHALSSERPATHWDITITEDVSANGFGPKSYSYVYHIGESFKDVPVLSEYMIENIFHNGITSGCEQDIFCPNNYVSRQQMAKFICTAVEKASINSCPVSSCQNIFQDVPSSNPFCSYIEAIKNLNIIEGCQSNPLLYCPSDFTTRQAMAKVVCSAMDVVVAGSCNLNSCSGIFTDVPSSNPFCSYIEALYNAGVISGCSNSPLMYCPSDYVKRLQMAKFLVLGFDLQM